MLDLTQARDAHINERLSSEPIIWLGTTRPDGRPHLVPVWFLWENPTILIFSQPDNQKIRNLRNNSSVMLALNAIDQGDDVVMIEGRAALIDDPDLKATLAAYSQKYDALLKRMGSTAEEMATSFSQAMRITPTRFIAWT